MTVHARVTGGWINIEEYDKLCAWLDERGWADCWDMNRGWSYINGRKFLSEIEFYCEGDLLLCKLAFPKMIYAYG